MEFTICSFPPREWRDELLEGFERRQEVFHCWRRVEGELRLLPVQYVEDWDEDDLALLSCTIQKTIERGGVLFGAPKEGRLVGFALLDAQPFGSSAQYLDLAEFYVSAPFRRQGLGRALFAAACGEARRRGARFLYISAHSAEDSMAAYARLGCTAAEEVNAALAEREPFDISLQFAL